MTDYQLQIPRTEVILKKSEDILEQYGKSLFGKTILVTGVSNESIAGELALRLATADPKLLILTARAESRASPIIAKIKETKPDVAVRFLNLELSDLSSIHKAIDTDLADITKIDHVVFTAGVMACPYSITKDGFEMQFCVNYLANFLLTKLLLPKIQSAGPSSSIIVVASSAVRQGIINFDDIGYSNGSTYDSFTAYCQSNVARVMFAKSLGEKLKDQGIRVYSIDPGSVTTGLQQHMDEDLQKKVASMFKDGFITDVDGRPWQPQQRSTRSEGASTMITGMIDPTISGHNGAYLKQNALADDELHRHVLKEENWTRLWELSEELIQESFSV
ncbi:uncharacterized protein N7483_011089 [Penicillium malachiteum]|uniref:uncharacterized protein n=1 Tax=Penicillium malachiteum TaxID=1324776 RepID=UPI0025466890|nr:uncharacterized protein N7483_011089 [Penicillium malachiteum]KAJ5713908.1 hypothetical protein N7483_011089 [Penicillium malachiteum]